MYEHEWDNVSEQFYKDLNQLFALYIVYYTNNNGIGMNMVRIKYKPTGHVLTETQDNKALLALAKNLQTMFDDIIDKSLLG